MTSLNPADPASVPRASLSGSIAVAAVAALCGCPPALAAASDDDAAESGIEEIVVTGSRVRGAVAPVGSPIISLGRDYIESSTATSVDELIHELPQVFDLGISEGSRGQSGGNGNIVWANSVNLRGIGPYATLVLVDGHRVNSNARSIDPSILPTLALERIEVVADGASAIYGSDAIAGVVNLIMRREVDGFDFVARRGFGEDYDEHKVGVSWGNTWEHGSFFAAYENGRRDNLNGRDRDFFRALQPGNDYRPPQCDPGNLVVGGVSYAIPEGGVTAANAAALTAGTQNLCEGLLNQDLLPQQEYDNVALTFTQDLNDWLEVYVDGYYANRDFVRHTGFASGNLTVPSTNAFFVAPPGTTPGSVTVQYSFEDDLPANTQSGYQRNWEVTSGFRAALPADWRLEGLVTYGDLREVSESLRGLDARGPTSDLALALASSDPATAFDPFGLHRTGDAVLDAISDQIFIANTANELLVYELSVDGPVLDLPGGTVQVAAGYERQEQTNEPGLQRGDPDAFNNVRHFERDVNSYYAELLVPIVGSGNAVAGIQRLDFNAAIRYDDYSDVGSTTNPKLGVTWSPIEDLVLRASYGTSFRAPLFSQLFGNSSALFVQPYSDPTQGGAIIPGVALSGGNLELEPEEATTWTVGFDYRPGAVPGLSVSATYFDVEYEGQIETYLADLSILAREAEFVGTGIILRDAAAEAKVQELLSQGFGVARGVLPVPVPLFVDGRTNNLGRSLTEGLDFRVLYHWSAGDAGQFAANIGGMYLTRYDASITPTGTLNDLLDTIFSPLDFKVRAGLSWSRGRYGARAVISHVGSYDNTRVSPTQDVGSFTVVDLGGEVTLGDPNGSGFLDGIVLGIDIENLFDEDPPYVNIAPGVNGGGGYDPSAADPVGRVYGISIRKQI